MHQVIHAWYKIRQTYKTKSRIWHRIYKNVSVRKSYRYQVQENIPHSSKTKSLTLMVSPKTVIIDDAYVGALDVGPTPD